MKKNLAAALGVFLFFSCSRNPDRDYKDGNKYFSSGNYFKAIEFYTKAIMTRNKFPQAITSRGLAYEKIGDKQKAIYEYEKSIRVDPAYLPAYNNLAAIYIEGRNYKQAEYYLNEAIKADPSYRLGYYSRGLCLFYTGDYESAAKDFSSALEGEGVELARYYRALADEKMGRFQEAMADLDALLEKKSTLDLVYYERGLLKLKMRDVSAVSDFSKAIELKENPVYYFKRASALLSSRYYEGALKDIDMALELSKDNPEYLYFKGDIYLLSGAQDKAKETYSEAYKISKDLKTYQYKLSLLDKRNKKPVKKRGKHGGR